MNNKKNVIVNKFDKFKQFYNYRPSTKLFDSLGVETAKFPMEMGRSDEYEINIQQHGFDSVDGVTHIQQFYSASGNTQHRLLVYASDKKLYINPMFNEDDELIWMYNLEFDTPPITLLFKQNDLDTTILASNNVMKVWKTGYSPYNIENVPIITSMCVNEGVLFCTIKEPAFKVWYATDLNAENIGNISNYSGYISLEDNLGYARKIMTFDQDVYVFRDYGISKISHFKKDINVSQVYTSNTKIHSNTVCQCGNIIMFMTDEGLYSFNGIKVSKTQLEIGGNINNSTAVATSLGDKYYLALKLDFKDNKQILCENGDYINNAIVVIDTSDFSYEIIRGVDVKSLYSLKIENCEKVLIVFNGEHKTKLGQIANSSTCFGEALPKYWASGSLIDDLNPKVFTKLKVLADKDIKFNLHFDNRTLSFTSYQSGLNEFCFKTYSKQIKISISASKPSAQVEKVELDYYEE